MKLLMTMTMTMTTMMMTMIIISHDANQCGRATRSLAHCVNFVGSNHRGSAMSGSGAFSCGRVLFHCLSFIFHCIL